MTERPEITPGQAAYEAYLGPEIMKITPLAWAISRPWQQAKWERIALAACEANFPLHRHPPAAPDSGRHASEEETAAYMQEVADFWLPIVKPGGVFDEQQLLLELADLSHLLNEVPKIYDELAGLSKPLYFAHVIVSEARARIDAEIQESLLETMIELHADFEGDEDGRRLLAQHARSIGIYDLEAEVVKEQERRASLARDL